MLQIRFYRSSLCVSILRQIASLIELVVTFIAHIICFCHHVFREESIICGNTIYIYIAVTTGGTEYSQFRADMLSNATVHPANPLRASGEQSSFSETPAGDKLPVQIPDRRLSKLSSRGMICSPCQNAPSVQLICCFDAC